MWKRSQTDTANIEAAKEALYGVAPYFSELGEKLGALEQALREMPPESGRYAVGLDGLSTQLVMFDDFLRYADMAHDHSEKHLKASRAISSLLEKGMSKPGVAPSGHAIKASGQGVESIKKGLVPMLDTLDEMIDETSPQALKARRCLDDCTSYIDDKLMPAFEAYKVDERLAPFLKDRNNRPNKWVAGTIMGAGIALIAGGGFLGQAGKALSGLAVVSGGVMLHKKGKPTLPENEQSSDPISR